MSMHWMLDLLMYLGPFWYSMLLIPIAIVIWILVVIWDVDIPFWPTFTVRVEKQDDEF